PGVAAGAGPTDLFRNTRCTRTYASVGDARVPLLPASPVAPPPPSSPRVPCSLPLSAVFHRRFTRHFFQVGANEGQPLPAPLPLRSTAPMVSPAAAIIEQIRERQNRNEYHDLHWEGSFAEYLELVEGQPAVARNAFQRLYDLIVSFGSTRYVEYKKEIIHYNFF